MIIDVMIIDEVDDDDLVFDDDEIQLISIYIISLFNFPYLGIFLYHEF